MNKKIICILTALVLVLSLCGCTKKVEVGGEKLPEDTQEITKVMQSGELSGLDALPMLTRADLSGSTCYDEIIAWKNAHPDVDVRYTVTFPDGTAVPCDVTELALPGAKSEDAQSIIKLISYLPELKKISFTGSSLGASEVAAASSMLGDIEVEYTLELFGKSTDYKVKELDLRGINGADITAALPTLASLPMLEKINLGSSSDGLVGWDVIGAISNACPQVSLEYGFELYGKSFNLSDTVIDINHIQVYDNGAEAVNAMQYMKNLETLDMDSCGVGDETMQTIRDMFPNVNVIWRVYFGDAYSVRTDAERILASKPTVGGNLTQANTGSLKYCTKVKYLDIGHNEILGDIGFVAYMPELEVAVLAMDGIYDLSPLAACTKLEYLEIQTNPFTDISPLSGLVNLEHLNMARNGGVTDLSPLKGLTKMQRMWIGSGKYPMEQVDELKALMPNCEFNTNVYLDPTEGRWRIIGVNPDPNKFNDVYLHPRYEKLIEQFGYTDQDYSFYWNDPKFYGE